MIEDDGTVEQPPDPEVLAARHEVELAKAELEIRLRDVGQAGRVLWTRVGRRARPILIGGAIAVSALLLIRALRPSSGAIRRSEWRPPGEPSLLRLAAGSVLSAVVRTAATELARQILTPTKRITGS